jgi:tRNA pseudouridine55 synthase
MQSSSSDNPTGLLHIDKPGGMTSHDVVNRVRRIAGQRRVGHAGTLDPLATGSLLLCLGPATRLIEYLVGQSKLYEAVVRLGQTTDSYDAEGEITRERPFTAVTRAAIEAALPHFQGNIQQLPPMYSAVKKDGRRLYELARQGVEVERAPRSITIYKIELLAWRPPDLTIQVACSSGTYIRSLAHDLGEWLGCGGHITALRRTAVGQFQISDATPLDQLTPENLPRYLQPMDTAVAHLPPIYLPEADGQRLMQGQRVARQADQPAELARVYDQSGHFLGVATAVGEEWQAKKIVGGGE